MNGFNHRQHDASSRSSSSSPPLLVNTTAQIHAMAPFFPGGDKSLSGIALRAFSLGAALALSLLSMGYIFFASGASPSEAHPVWRVPFFLASLCVFHFLEFWVTAERNTMVAGVDSFLLTQNWPNYAIAHSLAFLEAAAVSVFFPRRDWAPYGLRNVLLLAGLGLVVVGQAVRTVAMYQAGASFNHQVQSRRKDTHELVTGGVYAWIRHPSYFGFFYWGLGTQMVLGNLVCFVAYAAVLWLFFKDRIGFEEGQLVKFFGGAYVDYRQRTRTWIPFIP